MGGKQISSLPNYFQVDGRGYLLPPADTSTLHKLGIPEFVKELRSVNPDLVNRKVTASIVCEALAALLRWKLGLEAASSTQLVEKVRCTPSIALGCP